jgi:hypothetical protein
MPDKIPFYLPSEGIALSQMIKSGQKQSSKKRNHA